MSPYQQRAAENKQRLILLLSMRRQGKCQSRAYKALKTLAMRQYRALTNEAYEMYKAKIAVVLV